MFLWHYIHVSLFPTHIHFLSSILSLPSNHFRLHKWTHLENLVIQYVAHNSSSLILVFLQLFYLHIILLRWTHFLRVNPSPSPQLLFRHLDASLKFPANISKSCKYYECKYMEKYPIMSTLAPGKPCTLLWHLCVHREITLESKSFLNLIYIYQAENYSCFRCTNFLPQAHLLSNVIPWHNDSTSKILDWILLNKAKC